MRDLRSIERIKLAAVVPSVSTEVNVTYYYLLRRCAHALVEVIISAKRNPPNGDLPCGSIVVATKCWYLPKKP